MDCFVLVLSAGPDLGVCKELNGIGPPQGMGLQKKNYSPVVLLSTTPLKTKISYSLSL